MGVSALAILTWALPTHRALASPEASTCHHYHLGGDASARVVARAAETAAETLSTDHGGSYRRVSPKTLHDIEPLIAITPRQARRSQFIEGAYLLSASGTTYSYIIRARALNGDVYTITRARNGEIERYTWICGRRRDW